MSEILVKTVRVFGFRGLKNLEVKLEPITVLTGMNNTGKTSFLKAMQIALGSKNFISSDDFYINDNTPVKEIIVDVKIVSHIEGVQDHIFPEEWETVFTDKRFTFNSDGKQIVAIRTIASYDPVNGNFPCKHFVLPSWPEFKNDKNLNWYETDNGIKTTFNLNELIFIYTDAQRDLLEDLKVKHSFLGKMLSKINYKATDIEMIESLISELNQKAVGASDILSSIETTLKGLDSTMDNTSSVVEISPFAKKIRDLNKGVSIQYSDFSMEYHGMGTRSWASLLTLKSFIEFLFKNAETENVKFFPILAIEEPEAHLHPNAQKKLFSQISSIPGQKIISTHSSYIAASASLNQIRSFYKVGENTISGYIDISKMSSESIRKLNRQVVNTRGELLFAKAIVLAEGETEEQALSIFASKYFDTNLLETGINFVGVDGKGNYSHFVKLAESLSIPWFIFSDSDGDTINEVKAQLLKIGVDNYDNLISLDNSNDFEKQMIADGYQDEIKLAILESILPSNPSTQYKEAKRKEIDTYSDGKLYEILTGSKTQFGQLVSEYIIRSTKGLPPLVDKLFEKVKTVL